MCDIDIRVVQAATSVCGVLISLAGFAFVARQIHLARKAISQNTHARVYDMGQAVYGRFIDSPGLRPYFYDGVPLTDNYLERQKVFAASELLCDYFEYILIERSAMDLRIYDSWRAYMSDIFRRSPSIRSFIEDRRHQYTPEFNAEFDSAMSQTKAAADCSGHYLTMVLGGAS
jgi:hypothetical protein